MDPNEKMQPKQTAVAQQKEYQYKSLIGLSKVVRILLIMTAVISFIGLLTDAWGWIFFTQVKEGAQMTGDLRDILDGCVALQGLAALALSIVLIIAFLRWFYLLRRNMFALKAPFFKGHPLDIVGAFLIPIFNLYLPLGYAEDIWKATSPGLNPGQNWAAEEESRLIVNWWGFFVADMIANHVASCTVKVTEHTDSWKPFLTMYLCLGISEIISIVSCIFSVLIVAKLTERQEAHRLKMEAYEPVA